MRTGILVLASSLSIAGLGRADDLTGQLAQIAAGKLTPAAATSQVLDRAANADSTNAILALVPSAQSEAQGLSARFAGTRPPLFGTPIVVKDNIDVTGVANTAGSLALADNLPARDAPIIARLRAAGAVIVAKTNLSEWANIRSSRSNAQRG
jgi:amidase